MLVAILTILLLGGGTSAFLDYIADSKDAIKLVMAKDERQREALNVIKAMEKRSKGYNKQVSQTIKDFGKLLEGRENNATEIAVVSESHFVDVESYSKDILDLRFELKEQLTRKEWVQVFPEESI